ncbi:MAG: SMC-Scp complex subunit ScpB [Bacillota bacterium]|nr:SMC-Scp complex subunit ScpB [Bacillota bacterium]
MSEEYDQITPGFVIPKSACDQGDGSPAAIDRTDLVEALLFAHADPLPIKKLASILELSVRDTKLALDELQKRYDARGGLVLIEAGGEYQLATKKQYHPYVDRLFQTTKKRGLSNSSLEVLTIVAMRQPITKTEIEQIRGVGSDGALQSLLAKELIYVSGRLEKIGKPQQYSTTTTFLRVFGLKSLDELQSLEDIGFIE